MCWTVDKLVFELASGIRRSVASELGEVVSIRDSGADVGDCSAMLTSLNAVGLILNKNVETSMAPVPAAGSPWRPSAMPRSSSWPAATSPSTTPTAN